jgi:hypothetical protein
MAETAAQRITTILDDLQTRIFEGINRIQAIAEEAASLEQPG